MTISEYSMIRQANEFIKPKNGVINCKKNRLLVSILKVFNVKKMDPFPFCMKYSLYGEYATSGSRGAQPARAP